MIQHLLETYGYLAVLLLVGLESLGIPLPGETALLTASAYAATGHLSIVGVIAAAAIGAVLGDAGGYWIGRTGGLALVRRYGRLFRIDDAKLERAQNFFQRHGGKTVRIENGDAEPALSRRFDLCEPVGKVELRSAPPEHR